MLVGVFGDVHLTKNMRSFQDVWDITAKKSIYSMYDKFDKLNVKSVVCLGDFFDAPRIEAKHMQLVMPILKHINDRLYPTYILLGNHEIDSDDSNILDFLSMYENIIPVTDLTEVEDMLFIPYNVSPLDVDMKGKIVFTHHDIYGSELAGGKTKAFFGLDHSVFSEANLVMNGHVHLRSKVSKSIINAGSILVSQQGELKLGDYPQYYILDKSTVKVTPYDNEHSMIYLTIKESEIDKVINSDYNPAYCSLKVEYEDEIPNISVDVLHTSWRKIVGTIDSKEDERVNTTNFDLKNYLTEYIRNDPYVSDDDKEGYISLGLEMLDK